MKSARKFAGTEAMSSQTRRTGQADAELGSRIRRARMASKLSQEELACRIGVSCQQLQKYEVASNRVSVARLIDIADALKVDVASLLRDDHPTCDSVASEPEPFLRLAKSFMAIRHPASRQKIVELAEFLERLEHA